MPRYIDADALRKEIDVDKYGHINTTITKLNIAIEHSRADVVEIKKDGEWEMFDLISSAYYGKQMYFKEDNGTVYSRYSHNYMSVDDAIREFISLIDGTEEEDAEIH